MKKKFKVTDAQLAKEIQDKDVPLLAACFENVDIYLSSFDLADGEKTDIRKADALSGTQTAMIKCLDIWKSHTPWSATFKAVLDIMLHLKKGRDVQKVLEYVSNNC